MDMELLKQIQKSIKLSNHDLENGAPGLVLEQLRKEKITVTLLLELVSDTICELIDKEEGVLNQVLQDMKGDDINHRLEGPFVFQRHRGAARVAYTEPLGTQANILNPKDASQVPPEFVEKKDVFVLRRKEFEKALLRGDCAEGGAWIEVGETLELKNRNTWDATSPKKNLSCFERYSNRELH